MSSTNTKQLSISPDIFTFICPHCSIVNDIEKQYRICEEDCGTLFCLSCENSCYFYDNNIMKGHNYTCKCCRDDYWK